MPDAKTWVRRTLQNPIAWADVVQLVKTVIAAVIAWVLAVQVFDLPQPFLAPWAALLVVHSTVYRTFSRGAQQVAATVLGVIIAWATGNLLGLDPIAIGVMLLVGMLLGRLSPLRDEATTVAATALVVLTTGFSGEDNMLLLRLFDTSIGVVVGVVVNLVVWPPFRDRSAARAIDAIDDRVGALLCDIAAGLRANAGEDEVAGWVDDVEALDGEIDDAWGLVRQARESGRLNPRRTAAEVRRPGTFGDVLDRIEQSVAEIRSMTGTLGQSVTDVHEWEPMFRDRWVGLLHDAGTAIKEPSSVKVAEIRERLQDLTAELSTEGLSTKHWPEYGGLIVNLRNIVMSMDVVAKSNPVVVHRRRSVRG